MAWIWACWVVLVVGVLVVGDDEEVVSVVSVVVVLSVGGC